MGEGLSENPNFFICLYFIGAGGDENLKAYLVWPNDYKCIFWQTVNTQMKCCIMQHFISVHIVC